MSDSGRPSEDKKIVPLPLVIGVTGHRDLRQEDQEALETRVRSIFADLRSRYPHTPLILLSPLAEGADRLVAKVALERGVRLIVPLPMPRELYEQDFQTEASRDEFNKLLQQAERWFELPLHHHSREGEPQAQDPARDQQYGKVGAYIVLYSQILIALWDGQYSDKEGGTSQIVQLQLQGVPGNYPDAGPSSPLDEPENGPVYHIVTPRSKNTGPVEQAFQLRKLFPATGRLDHINVEQVDGENQPSSNDHTILKKRRDKGHPDAAEEFNRIFKRLDTFNREGITLGVRLAGKREQNKASLFSNLDTTTLSPRLKATLNLYADLFATADTLALYFRDRTVNTLRFLFGLFFIALICFDVFSNLSAYLRNFFGDVPAGWLGFLFLFFYLIFLSIAYYIWYYRATKGDYKNKYLDYRALAEGLRVQIFWRVAGLPDTVANHYLRKQKSELDWIRNSIRVANLLCDVGGREMLIGHSAITAGSPYRLIMRPWVYAQSKWFTDTAGRDQKWLEKNERWVRGFFSIGVVLALGLFILQFVQQVAQRLDWIGNVLPLLIVLMGLALVLAALREGFADKMAYAELAKQYQRMSQLYARAYQQLDDSLDHGSYKEVERVIRELGEEALAENGDWVVLHRARPLNVPIG